MRNRKFVRVLAWIALAAFVAVSLLSVIPFNVSAASAKERLQKAQQQQQELNKKLNDNNAKKKQEQANKARIDKDVAAVQAEIDALDAQIEEINDRIEAKDAELAAAHELSSKQFESYKKRVKLIVEKGSVTYLEVLINANSLEDFFTRMDVVEQIAAYDNNLLNELKENEQIIEALKIEIENERAQVMDVMEQSMAKKRALAEKKAASQKILDDLAASEKEITQEMRKAKEAEYEAQREIARLVSGDTSKYVGGKLLWPSTNSYRVTSPFSMRVHPTLGVYKQHTGMDIGAAYGTDVLAAADGTVIISGWNNAWGNYVVINHGGGLTTLYAHNSKLIVSKGQRVTRGQVIAKVGSTGYSTGPHIHFEVQVNGSPVNPMSYLQ
ncbi:MAG: hypothetical protein E7416_00475 [Ruminococcaceae bacterium]|nr:hypothetical protein [Oscillospiraceae bacterium]